jgi:hypothetical protein
MWLLLRVGLAVAGRRSFSGDGGFEKVAGRSIFSGDGGLDGVEGRNGFSGDGGFEKVVCLVNFSGEGGFAGACWSGRSALRMLEYVSLGSASADAK